MVDYVLEGKKLNSQAHSYIKKALKLPEYYGCNLDALYDCLTDICDLCRIHIEGSCWADPRILAVFEDAAEENDCILLELA